MIKKYPAVAALIPVVSGIVLADKISLSAWVWLVLAVSCILGALWRWARNRKGSLTGYVLAALLFLSGFSYTFAVKTFPPGHIVHYADGSTQYTIYATVDDWPTIKSHYTDIFASVDSLENGRVRTKVMGRILIHVGSGANFVQYGDRLILSGRLYPLKGGRNPNGFDYRRYLNLKSVFAVAYLPHQYKIRIDPAGRGNLYHSINYLRKQILAAFSENLSDSSAALASGFLIGETRDIDPSIYELFRDTGTLHLLAVSGSNVGLVVLIFLFLLRASPMKRVSRSIVLLVIIVIFSFLSYNQPSVVRAAVMAGLVLIGRSFQRRIDYNNIIAAAALIILIVAPVQLFDIGFQLSFATAWGLIFIMPKASQLFKSYHRSRIYRFIVFPLLVCMVAQIVSLPLSAYYFSRLPMVSFLSNLVIVPLVSIAVIGEVVLLFATLVLPILGTFIGSLLNPLLILIIKLLEFFNSISWSIHQGFSLSGIWLLIYFVLLVTAVMALESRRMRRYLVFASIISLIGAVSSGLFISRERDEITVLSLSSGYIAISQRAPAMVLLADLSLKDYSYTEKIVQPLLENWGTDDFNVIVLSGNYQTIKEALLLTQISDGGQLYVPAKYANITRDIAGEMSIHEETAAISLLEKEHNGDSKDTASIQLSAGLAVFANPKSQVIFADDEFSFANYSNAGKNLREVSFLVVPEITKEQLKLLENKTSKGRITIISNRLTRSARSFLAENEKNAEISKNILIPSQVGAAILVMKNGAFVRK